MRIPESLVSLVDHGVIDEVSRSLKSGKEADVYLVASEGEWRVAKVYKDAQSRSFKNRAAYTEGRAVRSSRDQRAMDKGSKYGRAQNEAAWQSAEVDMIYRLDAAGVRVPKPHHFIDGVLLMEMVSTPDGEPAPRLGEVEFSGEEAQVIFDKLLADVVRMLSAGVVHGDLSEFNVLVAAEGPVIIDFPQAVNAARNQGARKMLLRDVENLQRFLIRHVPATPMRQFAEEMWQLYERGELTATTALTGKFAGEAKQVNTREVLGLIEGARRDERFKRQQTGRNMRGVGGAPGEPLPDAHPHHGANQTRAHAPNQPHGNNANHQRANPPNQPHAHHANQPRPHAQNQPHANQTGHQRPHHNRPRPQHASHSPAAQPGSAEAASHAGPSQGSRAQQHPHSHPANQQRSPHSTSQQRPSQPANPQRPPHPANPQRTPHPANQQRTPHPANPQRTPHPANQQRPHAPGGARPTSHHHAGPRHRGPPAPIVETKPPQLARPPSGPRGPQPRK